VTKVVTFGAFVEILPGVEGLVHISELAPYHVENPREIVSQGDTVQVLILEIDAERRRLSLSMKRVEGEAPVEHDLGLSEEVFSETPRAEAEGALEDETPEETTAEAEAEPGETAEPEEPSPASDEAEDLAIAAGGTVADEEPLPESDAAAEAELESEES
jgi:small subunit ribosomal protein S1